ncbi:MAG: hypothetical protein HQK98_07135 [Nitrospirae bacterium]|nr:hypothetical protein [Nitrospirota bacterium]
MEDDPLEEVTEVGCGIPPDVAPCGRYNKKERDFWDKLTIISILIRRIALLVGVLIGLYSAGFALYDKYMIDDKRESQNAIRLTRDISEAYAKLIMIGLKLRSSDFDKGQRTDLLRELITDRRFRTNADFTDLIRLIFDDKLIDKIKDSGNKDTIDEFNEIDKTILHGGWISPAIK